MKTKIVKEHEVDLTDGSTVRITIKATAQSFGDNDDLAAKYVEGFSFTITIPDEKNLNIQKAIDSLIDKYSSKP
jgi:hypothetical protein